MRKTRFYKELKSYLSENHPELCDDESFISNRSELAQLTFIDSSQNGSSYEDSIHEAYTVLYDGLHFSSYQLLQDIAEEEFSEYYDIVEKNKASLYTELLPIIKEFNPGDDFERSSRYETLYSCIVGFIQEKIENNGIQ